MRRQMGMVFQHFNLFPNMTVRKNITLAPVQTKLMSQAEADAEADKLLARVGLADRGDSYPSAALRRPEAAHRHRAFACHAPEGHAL